MAHRLWSVLACFLACIGASQVTVAQEPLDRAYITDAEDSDSAALAPAELRSQLNLLQDRLEAIEKERNLERVQTERTFGASAAPSWRSLGPVQSHGRTVGSPFFAVPLTVEPFDAETYAEDFRVPGFPIRVNDVAVNARGAVVVDSTRLDPAAAGMFLPSAIPVQGEPFFGTGYRTTVQGQGSSVGLSWLAEVGAPVALTGGVRVEVQSLTADSVNVITPQAWVQWDRVLFGISDSTFTDLEAIPDTVDIGGPNGRPWIRSGQAQIRYTYLAPFDPSSDPTGFYGNAAVEAPSAEVYAPTGQGYAGFSRYPDTIATLRYQSGTMEINECTGQPTYDENWHLQLGVLVRDLGIERNDDSLRETETGWGTQLSGRYTIFRCNPCGEMLRDYVIFSTTAGEGIGHYFNDLRLVSAVNDAAFDRNVGELSPLPLFAYFGAYQHEWNENFRSTVVYSRIHLDSRQIPGGNTAVLPYEDGEYLSCNLMFHAEPCTVNKPPLKNVQHYLFAGIEYIYGTKENLGDASGDNHRVMLVVAASK